MSLSLAILFGACLVSALLSDALTRNAFCNWMPLKFAFGSLIFLALLFLPRNRLDATLGFSAYSSMAWLIIQFSTVVDLAYTWNEHWVCLAEETNKRIWLLAIVVVSVLFISASIAIAVVLFVTAATMTMQVSTVALFILMTILTVAAVTPRIDHGALLPSAIVTFYAYYQLWNAAPVLHTGPQPPPSILGHTIIGYTVALSSKLYQSLFSSDSATDAGTNNNASPRTPDRYNTGTTQYYGTDDPQGPLQSQTDEHRPVPVKLSKAQVSHCRLFLCSCFALSLTVPMMSTGWLATPYNEFSPHGCRVATAFQLTAPFVTALLYGWTLAAPLLFPDRAF